MTILTRQMVIDRLQAAIASSSAESDAATAQGAPLSSWAFDQFYAEEAGTISFEAGYRRHIGSVLDDLMFSDQPGFSLSAAAIGQMIEQLAQAAPADDDDDDDDDDSDDVELE